MAVPRTSASVRAGLAFEQGAPVGTAVDIGKNTRDNRTALTTGAAFGLQPYGGLPSGLLINSSPQITRTPLGAGANSWSNPVDPQLRAVRSAAGRYATKAAESPQGLALAGVLSALAWGYEKMGDVAEANIRDEAHRSTADAAIGIVNPLWTYTPRVWDENWRAAWNATQNAHSSPGQTLWLRTAFANQEQGDQYDPKNPYLLIDDPTRQAERDQYFGNGWAHLVTGSLDIGAAIVLDPLVVAGKGVSVLRASRNAIKATDVAAARKVEESLAFDQEALSLRLNSRLEELDLEDMTRDALNLGPSATAAAKAAAETERTSILATLAAPPDAALAGNLTRGGRRIRASVNRWIDMSERVRAYGVEHGDLDGAYATMGRIRSITQGADSGAIRHFLREADKIADDATRVQLKRDMFYSAMGDKSAIRVMERNHARLFLEIRAMNGPNRTTAMTQFLNQPGMFGIEAQKNRLAALNDDDFLRVIYEAHGEEIDAIHKTLLDQRFALNQSYDRMHDVASPAGIGADFLPDPKPGKLARGELRKLPDTNGIADNLRMPDGNRPIHRAARGIAAALPEGRARNLMGVHRSIYGGIGMPPIHIVSGRRIPNMISLSDDDAFESFSSALRGGLHLVREDPELSQQIRAMADEFALAYGPANPGAARAARKPIVDAYEKLIEKHLLDKYAGQVPKEANAHRRAKAVREHRAQLQGIIDDAAERRTAQMSFILERAQQAGARGEKDVYIQEPEAIFAIPTKAREADLSRPFIEPQLDDLVSVLDYNRVDHLFATQGATNLAGKMVWLGERGWRPVESFAGFTMDLWRFGVTVMRAGYPIRTQIDDQLRVLTVLGAQQYGQNLRQGVQNVIANQGHITVGELHTLTRDANLRAQYERLADNALFGPSAALARLNAETPPPAPYSNRVVSLELEAGPNPGLSPSANPHGTWATVTSSPNYPTAMHGPGSDSQAAIDKNADVLSDLHPSEVANLPPNSVSDNPDRAGRPGIVFLDYRVNSTGEVIEPGGGFDDLSSFIDSIDDDIASHDFTYGTIFETAEDGVPLPEGALADALRITFERERAYLARMLNLYSRGPWDDFDNVEDMLDAFGIHLARQAGFKALRLSHFVDEGSSGGLYYGAPQLGERYVLLTDDAITRNAEQIRADNRRESLKPHAEAEEKAQADEYARLQAEMNAPAPASAFIDDAPAEMIERERAVARLDELNRTIPEVPRNDSPDSFTLAVDFDGRIPRASLGGGVYAHARNAPEGDGREFEVEIPYEELADPFLDPAIFVKWGVPEGRGAGVAYLDNFVGTDGQNLTGANPDRVDFLSHLSDDLFNGGYLGDVSSEAPLSTIADSPMARAFVASRLEGIAPGPSWATMSLPEMLDQFGALRAREGGFKAIQPRYHPHGYSGEMSDQPDIVLLLSDDAITRTAREVAADIERDDLNDLLAADPTPAIIEAQERAAENAGRKVKKRNTIAQQKIGYGPERMNSMRTMEDIARTENSTDAEASVLNSVAIEGQNHLSDLRNRAMVPSGNYNHITGEHPDWVPSMLDFINRRLRSSHPMSMLMARPDDLGAVENWFKLDPQGRLVWDAMAGRWANVEELVEVQRHQLDLVLPTQHLRNKALAGEITEADVLKAFPEESARPHIPHEMFERADRGNALEVGYNALRSKMFHYANELPTEVLARHPFYVARHQQHLRQTLDDMDENKLTVSQYNQAVKRAGIMAKRDVSRYMFDTSHKSNLSHHLRFMTGFYSAWSDTMRKWGLIFGENLHAAPIGIKAFGQPKREGLVVDEEGNRIEANGNVVDNDGNVIRVSQDPSEGRIVVSAPPRVVKWMEQNAGGTGAFSLNVGSTNTIFQGQYPWLPGPSPLVAIPVNDIFSRTWKGAYTVNGKTVDVSGVTGKLPTLTDNPIVQYFLPFGTTQGGVEDQFQPPWLKNFDAAMHATFDPDRGDDRYAQIWASQLANELAQQSISGETLNPVKLQELIDRRTRNWFWLSFFGSESPISTRPVGRIDFYHQEYRRYLREFGNDPADAEFDSAKDKFFNDYPDFAGATVSLNFNKTGITPRDESWEEEYKYRKEIAANPPFGWLYVGAANVGPGFAPGVWTAQARAGNREKKDPAESMAAAYTQKGWFDYQVNVSGPLNLKLEERAANGGSSSLNANTNEDLRDIKADAIAALSEENHFWAKEYEAGGNGAGVNEFLRQADIALSLRPELANRRDFVLLAEYRANRAFVQEEMERLGARSITNEVMENKRVVWDEYVQSLVAQDIGFEQMYSYGNLDRDELRMP